LDGKYGKTPTVANGPSGADSQDSNNLRAPLYPQGSNYDPINGIDDMTTFTSGATVGNDAG
jgi:hypothetical protein